MDHGLNTLDPTIATRWVTEYENGKRDEMTLIGRHRNERRQMKDRLKLIADRAEGAGLHRQAFLDEIEDREIERKREARKAAYSEEAAEQRMLLKDALGGLPLGDWGVEQLGPTPNRRKKDAAVPGATPAAPDAPLTLAEAKEILARPKGKGRPSAAVLAQRRAAEKIVAEADQEVAVDAGLKDGAGGEQAAAMAEAMGPDEVDNIRDFRPPYLRNRHVGDDTPPEAA